MTLRYGSVCSGIEAATVAWHPLGWSPAFFAEVDKYPSAVLAHHYGSNMPGEPLSKNGVPNHGDFTKINADAGPVDLLVGGTPCQSFSVAGKRLGLDDPRGNLALEFLALARRLRARWIVWENVPGVLSSRSGGGTGAADGADGPDDGDDGLSEKDFAIFLQFVQECGYGFAYRVLDAQYVRVDGYPFAVPQRRRRVFLVGYLGDWRRAAAVLLEPEGMRGDPPPRRKPGQAVAPTIASRPTGGGGLGTDFDCDGGLISSPGVGSAASRPMGGTGAYVAESSVSGTVSSKWAKGSGGPSGDECQNLVAHALRREGFDASEDGTGRGTPLVPVAIQERAVSENPDAGPDGAGFSTDGAAYTLESRQQVQAVAFDCKVSGRNGFGVGETAPTLRAMGHAGSHQNAGGEVATAFAIMPMNSGKDYKARETGVAQPLMAGGPVGGNQGGDYVAQQWSVRRLTPIECERLQGFPDGYTAVPWRGKPPENCPDGPRYKALGNSMAVNVRRWIGLRIQAMEDAGRDLEGAQ